MRYKSHNKYIFLTAIFLGLFPSLSYAVGNMHLGGTELHPSISISHSYDDNIYLNDDKNIEKVGDSVTALSPSIELKRAHDERIFLLSYNVNILRFHDQDKEDREDHAATAFLETRFPAGLKLKLRDSFVKTAEPASSEITDKNKRTQNLFEVAIASNVFDRLSFELNYGATRHDYDEDSSPVLEKHDRLEETFGGDLLLKLLPKTTMFLEYRRGQIAYDEVIAGDERDSTYDAYGLGLRGQITSKLNLDIMGGYQSRKYESAAKTDFNRELASLSINYDFSEFSKFSLTGARKTEESFFVDLSGNSSNFFIENRISLNVAYKMTYKVSANLDTYYGVNDYTDDVDRKDTLSGLELNLKYNVKPWLSAGVGYAFEQRDSDLDPLLYSYDYQVNRYNLKLSALF
ncbi:MAG: outer membrane beta-barrel protein [bacterium]|nr:outer membrane beta-barrel protein [bacterium]